MNPHLHNPHLDGDSFFLKGGATGVLLVHGLSATTVEVRAFGERLHTHGYTVSGPLLPGHGTTPQELNRTRWQDWLETAVAAYHHLATVCDRVYVGGESTGAVLALYLASRQPEAAGVLAYSPAIKLNASRRDLIQLYLAAPFIESLPKEEIDVAEKWQGYPVNPLRAATQLLSLQQAALRRLPRVTQPILVMQGKHDTVIHPDSGRIILENSGSSRTAFHLMERSAHVILIDQELDEITDLSLAFLKALE